MTQVTAVISTGKSPVSVLLGVDPNWNALDQNVTIPNIMDAFEVRTVETKGNKKTYNVYPNSRLG